MADITSNPPAGFSVPDRISLQYLDYIRVDYQGLDPMSRDSDNDGIMDGDEAFNATRYALSADPDADGINDKLEFEFGTDFGDRDTDGDGLRDGVELGLSEQFIEWSHGVSASTGSYFERLSHSETRSPFNYSLIHNYDADNGATVTDPNNPDTDSDGVPDGWIDGWYYGEEVFPRLYRNSNNDFWDRYDNLDYWEYQSSLWGRKMDPDNVRQVYEGEDMNLNGKKEPFTETWSFDPYTFEYCNSGETNSTMKDTDSDGIEDGYEVWYSHLWPYFIYRDGKVEGMDPTVDDSNKDVDGIDILWEIGVTEGETDTEGNDSLYNAQLPDSQNHHRKATNDNAFAAQLQCPEPNRIQGFAQRLNIKAGELQDADYIEVKAEFFIDVYVEIWEGRDDDYTSTAEHMVYPERKVYSIRMPPTQSEDGWIKIPLSGQFNYSRTVSGAEGSESPVYFLVIRNSEKMNNGNTGFIWYTKNGNPDRYSTLIYCDSVFDGGISPEQYMEYMRVMSEGGVPEDFSSAVFSTMWTYQYPPGTPPGEQIYNSTFGYRLIDLDDEAIIQNVPRNTNGLIGDFNLEGNSGKLAIRILNFTAEEREKFCTLMLFGNNPSPTYEWKADVSIWSSFEPNFPMDKRTDDVEVSYPADQTTMGCIPIEGIQGLMDDMGYFWIVIEASSENSMESRIEFSESLDYVSGLYCARYNGANWEEIGGCNPAFTIVSNKFNSNLYGDDLSNYYEYIIGSHPKKNNTDLMVIGDDVYNDQIDDGAEIFPDINTGGVIYRTSFENGSLSFNSYDTGYAIYDGDGRGSEINSKYQISRSVENPPSSMGCCDDDDLYMLFELKDGSGVFRSKNESYLYIWKGTSVIPESQTNENGNKYCPGTVAILELTDTDVTCNYNPSDRNREIYFSNPFNIDTDKDGIVDGDEISWSSDSDEDSMSNVRDTDSDNDGILDRQEIFWDCDNDTDGKENMIDPDSDDDGLLDGNETSWNFDTDNDGTVNMLDPDSDGDGLADGWKDGMIWSWEDEEFVDYTDYKNDYSTGYLFPTEKWNDFDPWEGEDSNINGIHDRDEPDMTKVDTDGDSFWDGFDIYSDPEDRDGKPLHFGELYFILHTGSIDDTGMPFSGGDQNRLAQTKVPFGESIQMTSQVTADSDGDGLSDYEEILPWYILVEDFKPAFDTNPFSTIKSGYALNLVGTNDITSDPNLYDSDGDFLSDKDEYLFTNPLDKDSDNDGLSDREENWHNFRYKDDDETNPLDRDTDNDGLPDGWADGWSYDDGIKAWDYIQYGEMEFDGPANWYSFPSYVEFGEYMENDGEMVWVSNPFTYDTDGDEIDDGNELCFYWNVKSDPFMDSDGDEKGDLYEMDSDNDGLLDSEENINRNFILDGWWAVYVDASFKPSNAIWIQQGESYKIFHYNETDPTIEDCDGDGLLDSVEPDRLMDTDGDGYINAWDRDSNDAEGNGPGVGPEAWEGPEDETYCPADLDVNTDNGDKYDHIDSSLWATESDYNQTYIVFRTNCEDTDNDRKLDYDDLVNNSGNWISVDSIVNLLRNEDGSCGLGSEYALVHDWSSTAYLIDSIIETTPSGSVMQIFYGTEATDNPEDLVTPEGYLLIKNGDTVYIQINENRYVKCVKAGGQAAGDFETNVNSEDSFARIRSETIDGRPALNMDSDFDGIINPIENAYGTNRLDADTDNDGILDGDEPSWWCNSDGDSQFYSGFAYSNNFESINALDPDSDNDGILDGTEIGVSKVHVDSTRNRDPQSTKPHNYPIFIGSKTSFDADNGKTVTDPLNPDSDNDGLWDGWNNTGRNGVNSVGASIRGEDFIHNDYFISNFDYADGKIEGDADCNGIWSGSEKWEETSPNDADSDDDGISDKDETFNNGTTTLKWYDDFDNDGQINAVDPDSDNDGLYDGLERGYKPGNISFGTDLSRGYFIPDPDHETTDPFDQDSDDDNLNDGTEDTNHNGRIDGDNGDGIYGETETWKETSPNAWDSDQDSIRDNKEREFGYDPLSDDTDNDGLNDTEEDKNGDGDIDAGETNPTLMDSDNDGLTDLQEINGWTVVITYEATREVKEKLEVTSNPMILDTEGDGLSDYQEFTNTTNPNLEDSDGDGKTDIEELNNDFNSSPTGIDGVAPEIWGYDCTYEITYESYIGIKTPNGLKVRMKVGVPDIFGVSLIKIKIQGLEDQAVHTNNVVNTTQQFDWKISGFDGYYRALFKGFKINITATDRNNNVGFRNEKLDSIKDIVVSAFLGPLISLAKMITELVSGIFTWLSDMVKNLFNSVISLIKNTINQFLSTIGEYIAEIINSFKAIIDSGETSKGGLAELCCGACCCGGLMMAGIVAMVVMIGFITMGMLKTILNIVHVILGAAALIIYCIVSGVSFGAANAVDILIDVGITILLGAIVAIGMDALMDFVEKDDKINTFLTTMGITKDVATIISTIILLIFKIKNYRGLNNVPDVRWESWTKYDEKMKMLDKTPITPLLLVLGSFLILVTKQYIIKLILDLIGEITETLLNILFNVIGLLIDITGILLLVYKMKQPYYKAQKSIRGVRYVYLAEEAITATGFFITAGIFTYETSVDVLKLFGVEL